MSNEFWVLGASPRCALPAQYLLCEHGDHWSRIPCVPSDDALSARRNLVDYAGTDRAAGAAAGAAASQESRSW